MDTGDSNKMPDAIQDEDMSSENIRSENTSSENFVHRELRADVRTEIRAVIERYKRVDYRPPFTTPELIVMAILCSDEEALAPRGIMRWIVSTFDFYRSKALEEYLKCAVTESNYNGNYDRPGMAVEGFEKAFDDWETPLVDRDGRGIIKRDKDDECWEHTFITVPISAGRIYLQKLFEPERVGVFPFLELPAELRNTIYEMVFSFPETGINVRGRIQPDHGVMLLQREHDRYHEDHNWLDVVDSDALMSAPMQTILALLSVNKQVYDEAMPYFYQVNFFNFSSTARFTKFFNRVPIARLQNLGHVSIWVDGGPYYYADPETVGEYLSAVQALSKVKSFRRLEIRTQDDDWFSLPREIKKVLGRTKNFTKIEQLPGIRDLAIAASKAQVLELRGACPRIERYLRSEAEKMKAAKSDSLAEPKRPPIILKIRAKSAKRAEEFGDEEGVAVRKRTKLVERD